MATTTGVEEVGQPSFAIRCRRDSGRDKTITIFHQRFQILPPKLNSISRVQCGLAGVIRPKGKRNNETVRRWKVGDG